MAIHEAGTRHVNGSHYRLARVLWHCLLVFTAGAPLLLAFYLKPHTDEAFLSQLGMSVALVGFPLLAFQFVSSVRIRRMEKAMGMDILLQTHKRFGVLVLILLVAHPFLLAAADGDWKLVYNLHASWYIWVGRVTLLLLIAHVLFAVRRSALRMDYVHWKVIHGMVAVFILIGGGVHSFYAGSDMEQLAIRVAWLVLAALACFLYAWQKWGISASRRKVQYTVIDVRQETEHVWTIWLAPEKGTSTCDYLPGQYHYLTLLRSNGLPVEEHPFTISSSPTEQGYLCSTIKASGNYTDTIRHTQLGDKALVHAPFGQFSYVLHPHVKELVFIAAGVGITPLMSMLKHMRDTRDDIQVLLIYANRNERHIVFHEELERLQAECSWLKVVHIISNPGHDWTGERGRLNKDILARQCGDRLQSKAYYVCAPVPMIRQVTSWLQELGVADRHIHFEDFSL